MKYVIGRYFVVIQLNELYISLIKYLILVRVINDLLQLSSDLYLIIIDKLNLSTINTTHLLYTITTHTWVQTRKGHCVIHKGFNSRWNALEPWQTEAGALMIASDPQNYNH